MTWKRVRRLAIFRVRLAAVILGHRIRRKLKQGTTRQLVKEIQQLLRREGRQVIGYLKEQQRKKLRPLINQLICTLNGKMLPSPKKQQPAKPVVENPTSRSTSTLFKKRDD